jgi:hypothetical protein
VSHRCMDSLFFFLTDYFIMRKHINTKFTTYPLFRVQFSGINHTRRHASIPKNFILKTETVLTQYQLPFPSPPNPETTVPMAFI